MSLQLLFLMCQIRRALRKNSAPHQQRNISDCCQRREDTKRDGINKMFLEKGKQDKMSDALSKKSLINYMTIGLVISLAP